MNVPKKSPAGAGLIQGSERRSIMDRTEVCWPTYGYSRASRNFLVFGSFSALKPSLGHSVPRRLAGRISRGLRHLLALGGVSQKFVSWIDGSHGRSLLGFPSPPDTILMADRARQPALDRQAWNPLIRSANLVQPRPRLPFVPRRLRLRLRLLQARHAIGALADWPFRPSAQVHPYSGGLPISS